jgi:hypothetical protein
LDLGQGGILAGTLHDHFTALKADEGFPAKLTVKAGSIAIVCQSSTHGRFTPAARISAILANTTRIGMYILLTMSIAFFLPTEVAYRVGTLVGGRLWGF